VEEDVELLDSILVTASADQLVVDRGIASAYGLTFRAWGGCARGANICRHSIHDAFTYGYAGTDSRYQRSTIDYFTLETVKVIAAINQQKQDQNSSEDMDTIYKDLAHLGPPPPGEFLPPREPGPLAEVRPPAGEKPPSSGSGSYQASGSGFVIATRPLILTNAHVVARAKSIDLFFESSQKKFTGVVLYADPKKDLAVLTTQPRFKDFDQSKLPKLAGDSEVSLGMEVYSLGYPLIDVMGTQVKYSAGSISGKEGLGGDQHRFQLSVPTQPGNSGGPVFLKNGHLAGVMVSTLNPFVVAKEATALPQNVNFAINGGTVEQFFRESGLDKEFRAGRRDAVSIDEGRKLMVRIEVQRSP
jgi:S1-C subfamily serine protease